MKLPTRKLGATNEQVSCIGLGCMGMSWAYGERDDENSVKVLNRALDLGCNFWDTAEIYGNGDNEKLLSKVLKERRKEVFLCTKFGINPDTFEPRGHPDIVRKSCENSLKNLGIDQIDLYYQHRVDPKVPIEDTVKAMAELVKEGKIRYIGLSECSAETIRKAHAVHPITAVQIEYSPWETHIERNDVLKTCRELNISIVAYSPLGRGILTGAIKDTNSLSENDNRKSNPRYSEENFKHNYKIVEALKKISDKKKVKPSQLCIAWVLAQGQDFIPIPGTKKVHYLEENLEAANIKLSTEEMKEVREILTSHGVKGDRYGEKMMPYVLN